MKIVPLREKVLVREKEMDRVTKSGIFLPDCGRKEPLYQAEVISVGPGKMNEKGVLIPTTLKPGQVVLFRKYMATEFECDGEKLLLVSEIDVQAVLP